MDQSNTEGQSEMDFMGYMLGILDVHSHRLFEEVMATPETNCTIKLLLPQPRILNATSRTLIDNGQNASGKILFIRDITHESEVDRMKSEFLSTAAHELRTPLASILGFSELMKSRAYDENKRSDIIDIIYSQSQALKNLLDDLLDIARIEARTSSAVTLRLSQLDEVVEHSIKAVEGIDVN